MSSHIIPLFFSLNHIHYARWVAVHTRDMNELESSHPDILQQFNNGKFTMCNSHSVFSNIALDQGHEQNNAVMKGDGGFIGLTQDPDALLK